MAGVGTAIPPPAPAALGRDWTRQGTAVLSGADLVLTQAGAGAVAGSSFYAVPLPTEGLSVKFTADLGGGTGGTGMCLVLADPNQTGPGALGAAGPGLGFAGIPGVAVALSTGPLNQASILLGAADGTIATIAVTTALPQLHGTPRAVTVQIQAGFLLLAVDGTTALITPVPIGATALLGFTAATGTHDDHHTVRGVVIEAADTVPTPRDRGAISAAMLGAPGGVATLDGTGKLTAGQSSAPSSPWVFDVTAYGARGDGRLVADASIGASSRTLASPTAGFTIDDVGKLVAVPGAAIPGVTTLVTTITQVIDPGHVQLAAPAATAVTGGLALWASDDTEAIQAAINAGHAWASMFASNYRIYSPVGAGRFYGIGGPLVTGGTTLGNGQLTVPINPEANNGILASFEGVDTGANTRHWNQTTPAMTGSTWVSFGVFASVTAQSASAGAAGTPAVLSGPTGVNGYGTSAEQFSNVTVRLKNLTILTTHSSFGLTYGVLNAHGCARAILEDFSYGTVGTRVHGDYNSPAGFASGYSIGVLMPANGNNAMATWRRVICQGGYTVAVYATEHCTIEDSVLLYCWSGLGLVGYFSDGGTSAVGALHAVHAGQLAIEGCVYQVNVIGPGSGGSGPMLNAHLDTEGFNQFTETTSGTHGIPSAAALGTVHLSGANGPISTTYPTAMQIINDLQPPGPAATPGFTLGTPQINAYWRWATVLLAGGSVTAVKVSALMGGAAAPTMTAVWTGPLTTPISIRIPPGAWWEIDGTAVPAVNSWTLD